MTTLTIGNTSIRQDSEGRYCLNDLHKAAGGEERHKPIHWLSNSQTKELINEMQKVENPTFSQRGRNGGTYAVRELVYAYAMWISPAFNLKVIKAYDTLQTQGVAVAELGGNRPIYDRQ